MEGIEKKYLEEQRTKSPELFVTPSGVEGGSYLQEFGIYIPDKDQFPTGVIKTIPSDFIVEEIGTDNQFKTANFDSIEYSNQTPQEYTSIYATLVKCGLSTIEVVRELTNLLNIPTEYIGYAGIKDKNAVTAQEISIKKVRPETLGQIKGKSFYFKNIHAGKGFIQKGQLNKNKFTILVRTNLDENTQTDILSKQIQKVFNEGFNNYYYLQRFGSPRYTNFIWGSQILAGKYQEAVKHFLCFEAPREIQFFKNIRKEIANKFGQWEQIRTLLENLPIVLGNELRVVNWLCNHPSDYIGALLSIPEQVMLWVYAVSSILFNDKIASALQKGEQIPSQLPLLLSDDRKDVEIYSQELKAANLYPFTRDFIKPFKNIIFQKRLVPTKSRAELYGAEIIDEGLVISFSLGKGEYATTLLSHLFNLTYGRQETKVKIIDLKLAIGEPPMTTTLEKFREQITSRIEEI